MSSNDGAFLYVLFTFQFLAVLIGFPMLVFQVSSKEKRADANKLSWFIKLLVLCFVAKWLTDTYELVMLEAEKTRDEEFNPYRLLGIENDGSFNSKEIRTAYKNLAKKYHPDSSKIDAVSDVKLEKKWYNLVRAYETLT